MNQPPQGITSEVASQHPPASTAIVGLCCHNLECGSSRFLHPLEDENIQIELEIFFFVRKIVCYRVIIVRIMCSQLKRTGGQTIITSPLDDNVLLPSPALHFAN